MPKTNERTLKMMHDFIFLHDEGYNIPEIAKKYNLSTTTIYNRLAEIAEKAGVTRESLLERSFVADHSGRNFTPVKKVDVSKFQRHFENAMAEIGALRRAIDQSLEDHEIWDEIMKEEIK